jgi:hypothetical protein
MSDVTRAELAVAMRDAWVTTAELRIHWEVESVDELAADQDKARQALAWLRAKL